MTATMLATPYVETRAPVAAPDPDLRAQMPLLNRLRFLSQCCRAEARLDLAQACAAIHASRERSLDAVSIALVRVISQAVEGRIAFLAPGARETNFDETWLLRVLDRAAQRDTASVEFLLRRRVPPRNHHAFRSIIRAVGALSRH